jgi:hypothetical protein
MTAYYEGRGSQGIQGREVLRRLWKRSVDQQGLRSCDAGTLEYLTYLSGKHDVEPYELLNSFFEAEKKNTCTCGPLKITLRARAENHAIFLLKKESEIVAQMRFRSDLWKNPAETRRLYSILVDRIRSFKQLHEPPSSIRELRKGMKNVDLTVKVTGKSEVTRRYSRYDGRPLRFCLGTVSDASGSIRLPLWNDQIDSVSVGDEVEIKSASVKTFRGLLQIVPNRKKGELNITKPMKQVIQSR